MYWDDHNPPHYHARYGEFEAWIALADASVINGSLPPRVLRLVRTWHELHETEIQEAWNQAKVSQSPGTIDPLP
jgi:hypothetical protein